MSLETTNAGLQKALAALRKQNQQLKLENQIWRNTAMSSQLPLVEYLQNLNSAESLWGVWVNPENVDEYRIGQFQFENGGILDDWICAGSLDTLSFGHQSMEDAIEALLTNHSTRYKPGFVYKGKEVRVNVKGILEAYREGNLDFDFLQALESEAEAIANEWSKLEAEDFVYNKLPEIIEQFQESSKENTLIYS
jgi:hypothetical protein